MASLVSGDDDSNEQGLGRLVLELAFPEWAMFLPADYDDYLGTAWEFCSPLMSGMIVSHEATLREGSFTPLYAGSRAEGLAMEPCLGYDMPDLDVMFVYKDGWAVRLPHWTEWSCMPWHVPDRCTDDNFPHLQLSDEGCPAGYCKVKVNGSPKDLIRRLAKALNNFSNFATAILGSERATKCLLEREGTLWLSSSITVETFRQFLSATKGAITGPASHLGGGEMEIIVTLICVGPLPVIREFHSRPRQCGWPRTKTINRILVQPGMLVCASHKLSPDDEQTLQFRVSFSLQELMLTKGMPRWVKQGYIAFKLTVKSLLTRQRHPSESEGRSHVCSYHLKTVLFWTLEDPGSWETHCPYQFMRRLLTTLRSFITNIPPVLPNYFIPECNLFEHTKRWDIELLLQVVEQIQGDPFKYILDAPSSPGLLFGRGIVVTEPGGWKRLVPSLRGLDRHDVGASKEQLQECVHMLERSTPHQHPFRWLLAGCLLSRVECYRKWLWQKLRHRDLANENMVHRVYRRPPPRRLMGIWRGIKTHVSY